MLRDEFVDKMQDWSAKDLCKEEVFIWLEDLYQLQNFIR